MDKSVNLERGSVVYLRLALAGAFLSAVADRFGLWGAVGDSGVVWGDFKHFLEYTAVLNPYLPSALIAPLGWLVTFAEVSLAVLLLLGVQLRYTGLASAALLSCFGIAMALTTGVKSPFDYSVFSAAAASLGLAALSPLKTRDTTTAPVAAGAAQPGH